MSERGRGPADGSSGGPDGPVGQGAVADPPRGRPSAGAVLLGAVLPGAGHALAGAPVRGLGILLAWVALLAVAWLGREPIRTLGATGSLDDQVAAAALAVGLWLVWVGALRDLRRVSAASVRGAAGATGAERGRPERTRASQWAIAVGRLRRDRLAVVGTAVLALLFGIAVLAPLIAPYDPLAQGDLVRAAYLPPSPGHWLGTDQFGRDLLSRILYGARVSLAVGCIAVAIAVVLGSLLGAIAGYLGGRVDTLIMRLTDMVMAFPRLVLLIMVLAVFEPSLTLIILVLGLTQWPGTARLVRGEVLSLREREYVEAARALGFGRRRIILRHLIPNVLAPVIVAATLGIGNTIVLEAGLSFLGLGIQPPTPSWGTLVADGRQNLVGAWWVATFPGLAIALTVLAFNVVGDGLRDALDPRLRS